MPNNEKPKKKDTILKNYIIVFIIMFLINFFLHKNNDFQYYFTNMKELLYLIDFALMCAAIESLISIPPLIVLKFTVFNRITKIIIALVITIVFWIKYFLDHFTIPF